MFVLFVAFVTNLFFMGKVTFACNRYLNRNIYKCIMNYFIVSCLFE